MKLDLIVLSQLLCAVHKVSDSSHLSKTKAQRTQNASLQHWCFTRLCSDAFKVWWDFLMIVL